MMTNDVNSGVDSQNISELSQEGYQYLRLNMLNEAEQRFENILSTEPLNNYALVGMGDIERRRGNFNKAEQYYRKCLDGNPDNNYALFGLAECYKALNRHEEAAHIWERYLSHDSRNLAVLTRVAESHRKNRNYTRSLELYRRVLDIDPDNPYALVGAGRLHYDFNEYSHALDYWEKMIEIGGDRIDIRMLTSIGNCLRRMKDFRRGLEYFKRAVTIEANNFYALFGIADCYRGIGEPEQALEYLEKILEFDPRNKVILTRVGDIYHKIGMNDKAEHFYQAALDVEFDSYAILGLAMLRKHSGEYQKAIDLATQIIAQGHKIPRAYIVMAESYERMHEPEKALGILNKYVSSMDAPNSYINGIRDRIKKNMQKPF